MFSFSTALGEEGLIHFLKIANSSNSVNFCSVLIPGPWSAMDQSPCVREQGTRAMSTTQGVPPVNVCAITGLRHHANHWQSDDEAWHV